LRVKPVVGTEKVPEPRLMYWPLKAELPAALRLMPP
jgi:hypothetical protein